jgi:cytidylate kinase
MKTLDDIDKRDERDENRSDSPLRIAKDAIVIDTGKMNKEEVLSKTLKKISELKNVRGI